VRFISRFAARDCRGCPLENRFDYSSTGLLHCEEWLEVSVDAVSKSADGLAGASWRWSSKYFAASPTCRETAEADLANALDVLSRAWKLRPLANFHGSFVGRQFDIHAGPSLRYASGSFAVKAAGGDHTHNRQMQWTEWPGGQAS